MSNYDDKQLSFIKSIYDQAEAGAKNVTNHAELKAHLAKLQKKIDQLQEIDSFPMLNVLISNEDADLIPDGKLRDVADEVTRTIYVYLRDFGIEL